MSKQYFKDNSRKYRFFFHYNRYKKKMSIHYRGKCHLVSEIVCLPKCESKFNKSQPYVVMQGKSSKIVIGDGVATILH